MDTDEITLSCNDPATGEYRDCWKLSDGRWLCELLPYCGCFDPKADYQKVLACCEEEKQAGYPRDDYHQMLLLCLDDRGLLEHGSAIRYSWRTPFGDEVLAAMRSHWGADPPWEKVGA